MTPLKTQSLVKFPITDSASDSIGQTSHSKRSTPWFEDGNVVLEAEMTRFKVYRGILATNSAIFSDMFSIGQPGIGRHAEGCPVVHLSDKADDLKYILEALHDSKK